MREYFLDVLRGRLIAYGQGGESAVTGEDALEHVQELLTAVNNSTTDSEVQYAIGLIYWARHDANGRYSDFEEAIKRFRHVDAEHAHMIPARALRIIHEIPLIGPRRPFMQ